MARRVVATYQFSPDGERALGERLWALLRGRVIDELTEKPPRGRILLDTSAPHCFPRIAVDGLVGLVGVPRHVFQPRSTPNYTIRFVVMADGYIPRHITGGIPDDRRTIAAPAPVQGTTELTLNDISRLNSGELLLIGLPGPTMTTVQLKGLGPTANQVRISAEISTGQPGLPHSYAVGDPVFPIVPINFAPTDLGELRLHREPTVITGRTVQAIGNTTIPLAGASIRVTGIWRITPPANASVPASPPNLVSLQPPVYGERPMGTGQLRRNSLPPVPDLVTEEKRLLADVPAGIDIIRLSNRIGLNLSSILLIDAETPDLWEYLAISAIQGASDPAEPTTITLRYPLTYAHRRNRLVQRTNPQPPGTQRQFLPDPAPGEPDAIAEDTTVFLNTLSGLIAGNQIQITGGPNPNPEYHRLRFYSSSSDAEGYYRLPPLSRVARLEIRAEHGVLTPVQVEFRPDYTLRENRLDFVFR